MTQKTTASRAASTGQLQSVHRALDLLEALADPQQQKTLSALAGQLGLARSTTHRLLSTLVNRGYAGQEPDTGHYNLGVRAYQVGSAFLDQHQLRDVSRPIMRALVGQVNETVNLAVMDQDEAVYVDNIDSSQTVRTFARIGARVPLHATAVGKALLTGLSAPEVRRIVMQRGLPRFTGSTTTHLDALLADLERHTKLGYVLDQEEYHVGVRCAAAPVRDHTGRVIASLSASGPAYRIDDAHLRSVAARVRAAAEELSRQMGYAGVPRP